MSFNIFFDFSVSLAKDITVPAGTLKMILEHVASVEKRLGFNMVKFENNPPHWDREPIHDVSDETYCEVAERHNNFVRWLYGKFGEWYKSPPLGDNETITPEQSEGFFYGLVVITVPFERWTPEYYMARMQDLYDAFRGREEEGIYFDAAPLSIEQARSVMIIFQEVCGLDRFDLRLDVPRGHDHLVDGDDYVWCDKCGKAIMIEEVGDCRRKNCPLQEEGE